MLNSPLLQKYFNYDVPAATFIVAGCWPADLLHGFRAGYLSPTSFVKSTLDSIFSFGLENQDL